MRTVHAVLFSVVVVSVVAGSAGAAIVTPVASMLVSSSAVRTGASEGMLRVADSDQVVRFGAADVLSTRAVAASVSGPITGQVNASIGGATAAFNSSAEGSLVIPALQVGGQVGGLSPSNGVFFSPTSLLYTFNLDEPSTLVVDFSLTGVGRDFHVGGIIVDGVEQRRFSGFAAGSIVVPISAGDHSFELAVFSTLAGLTPGDLGVNIADARFDWRFGAVPTPGTAALLGLAGLAAARRRRA